MRLNGKKWKWLWGLVLVLAWSAVAVIFYRTHGNLTAAQLLDFTPEDPLQAVLVMLGLFLLKSVDFMMHSGVLYTADGIMFPLPAALALNLLGAAIMVTPPYFLGRSLGRPVAQRLKEKYPKLANVEKLRLGNGFLTALLLRVTSLPLTFASVYMGATDLPFRHYLTGSLVGLLPVIVSYSLMGAHAEKPASPAFLSGVALIVVTTVTSLLIYALLLRRAQRGK